MLEEFSDTHIGVNAYIIIKSSPLQSGKGFVLKTHDDAIIINTLHFRWYTSIFFQICIVFIQICFGEPEITLLIISLSKLQNLFEINNTCVNLMSIEIAISKPTTLIYFSHIEDCSKE